MCGIAGFAGWRGGTRLGGMVKAITHRGPDSTGECRYGEDVGLGFARLAIVDVVGGNQPLSTVDNRLSAVVNGEIYNHEGLRAQLVAMGHRFRSSSDCEVVLHGYAQWGTEIFRRLEGMFAAAIWDDTKQSLILARDPIGKKPIYWACIGSGIVFASEIKAMLGVGFEFNIDPISTAMYLVSDSVPTPSSIFSEVSKLQPGTSLVWKRSSGVATRQFWTPDLTRVQQVSLAGAVDSLETSALQATQKRLMADVPIGVFLSSGVDSLTVAAAARSLTQQQLHSFTLAFDDPSYNEAPMAAVFAEDFGFTHHEIHIGNTDLLNMVDVAVRIFDEPLNDPASLVMLRLAQEASHSVKVALTGDGGDELFFGYPHIKPHAVLEGLPTAVQSHLQPLGSLLARARSSDAYMPIGYKLQRLARGLGQTDLAERDMRWRGAFVPESALTLLNQGFRENLSVEDIALPPNVIDVLGKDFDSYLDIWSWLTLRSYLLDTVLVKVDRATMAYGVEARSPLLDSAFVETVFSIPLGLRTKHLGKKYLLRKVLGRISPHGIAAGKKHGMGVPTIRLLKGPLWDRLLDYAAADFLNRQGIFERSAVLQLLQEFNDGRVDRRKEVWGFFMYQAWFEQWVQGPRVKS